MQKFLALLVAVSLSFVLYTANQRSNFVDQLEVYGSSTKPNAPLIADFAACLRQQSLLLPLRAVECGTVVAGKHGPDAQYRVDVLLKSTSFR